MKIKNIMVKSLLSVVMCATITPVIGAYTVHAQSDVPVVSEVDTTLLESSLSTTNTYLTGYLDENGEIQFYTHVVEERGVLLTIAVYVGKVLVGYIAASVVDGVVISATGKSGGQWVADAISSVVNRPYRGSVYLPASGPYTCPGVVIDHSGMCQ